MPLILPQRTMSEQDASTSGDTPGARQLWPIFICYRQADGLAAARRLHELLDKRQVTGPKGEQIQLDVYLDQTMPAVADWRDLHRPYLERARAILVVCSPGAKINEGPDDWVYREINWWLEHRTTAPILIDPLRQGLRYVPSAIGSRWPEIQRIPLVESEWTHLPAAEREEKAIALQRQIVGAILPSGAAIYVQELETERQRAEGLTKALQGRTRALILLAGALVVVMATLVAAVYAMHRAEVNQRVSQASLYDARAASAFDEARRHEARWEGERQRKLETRRELLGLPEGERGAIGLRKQNLRFEIQQLEQAMQGLSATAAVSRQEGYVQLKQAEDAWGALENDGHRQAAASRTLANAPYIFSIELIGAGRGESILIHYGTPDATRLVMINGGPGDRYSDTVRARLTELKLQRFGGAPTPIELFVVSDQDEDKSGGLLRMLKEQSASTEASDRVVDIRLIWANIFASFGLRGEIRSLIGKLGIPMNSPFDYLVLRPDKGRLTFALPGDLEIVVIGPDRARLMNLYTVSKRNDDRLVGREPTPPPIESFPEERFSRMKISEGGDSLLLPSMIDTDDRCKPSENARELANVKTTDKSVVNLASTVLLFRYRSQTFLYTGDSRADLIMEGLKSSGLIGRDGRGHVSLLHLPHLGSNRNLTSAFLEQVTADAYLFSGDGTHGNPEVETIAALVAARPCAKFTMNFVNRDGARTRAASEGGVAAEGTKSHGEKLDAFFAEEGRYNPKYRRVFRATEHGSVIIDLLDRVTN